MALSEYSQKHIRRIIRFERQFTRPMYNEIRRPMLEVSEVLKASGVEAAMARAEKIIIVPGIGSTIQDIYVQVGLWAGNRTLREINASAREQKAGFGLNEKWTQDILNYFRLFLLNKAVLPISATTKGDILNILNKGTAEGWGIDRMAFELERVDLPLWRARLIVRTEIAKAQYFGTELGKEESVFETQETWIAARDHRTRHSHRDVNGKVVPEGGRWQVARYRRNVIIGYDMMRGPGDPDASPENICNCRCTKSVRVKRDERGRLIRKPAASLGIAIRV